MKTQNIFHAFPKTLAQVNALKAFMQALKIEFKEGNEKSPYNPEFVKKIGNSGQSEPPIPG